MGQTALNLFPNIEVMLTANFGELHRVGALGLKVG